MQKKADHEIKPLFWSFVKRLQYQIPERYNLKQKKNTQNFQDVGRDDNIASFKDDAGDT